MVKQVRRSDRSALPPRVRLPVGPTQKRPPPAQRETGSADSSTTTEEERGADGGGSGQTETKRAKMSGAEEEAAAPTNRERASGSCGPAVDVQPPDQQRAEEDSKLQSVGSLKVTIQQSSGSREFGPSGGPRCHICNVTCGSLQVFQEHMSGPEHLKKLQEITQSVRLSTMQHRGRRPDDQRWCDTCQTYFSGDVIVHRRTKQHKMCKQMCRPFCPVCQRHFRTPRKFVEHMKSPEHKRQVHPEEEELITVDAVGCFQEKEEKEEEEEEEEVEEVEVADEEEDGEGAGPKEEEPQVVDAEEAETDEYDPHTTYGSSFVVPVRGFVCRLCNKFFYGETTARRTHCRTHTHYLHLQSHRAQTRRPGDEDGSALT